VSVYLTAAVRKQLDAAQDQLDRHTPLRVNGRCGACGADGPCPQRRAALRLFGRYRCVPRRWPVAPRPDPVQPRAGWSGWFAVVRGEMPPNG
jgi:hypothetical protein